MIRILISEIISIIFPPICYGCSKEGFSLCKSCLDRSRKTIDTPYNWIASVYSFKEPIIKKSIHAIKYFHRRDLIEPLTKELACEINTSINQNQISENWVLIPIPMPRIRKYIRGYNQAELISLSLSKQCSLPTISNTLIRTSSPKRQVTTKTRGERLKNQHNSFKVIKDVTGLNIVLVDDVTTTGATLSEARSVLLKAGARSVKAVTIAH
ncbi:MAG: hypothetical protein K9L31_02975 [Candidatus Pacebacteria bacterium]|nr:hypothetical protein [Candidatus Paceibacterota bacterium]